MNEDQKLLIDEWFGDCGSIEAACELYTEMRMEMQKQRNAVIQLFIKEGK